MPPPHGSSSAAALHTQVQQTASDLADLRVDVATVEARVETGARDIAEIKTDVKLILEKVSKQDANLAKVSAVIGVCGVIAGALGHYVATYLGAH